MRKRYWPCFFWILNLWAGNQLEIAVGPYGEVIDNDINKTEITSISETDHHLESDSGKSVQLAATMEINSRWHLLTAFAVSELNFSNKNYYSFTQDAHSLLALSVGASYALTNRFHLLGSAQIIQHLYPNYEEAMVNLLQANLLRVSIPQLLLGFDYQIWEWKQFELIGLAELVLNGGQETEGLKVRPGGGVKLSLAGQWHFIDRYWLKLKVDVQNDWQEIQSDNYTGNMKRVENKVQIALGMIY